ncbi:MAG: aspartate kinase [Simkaniaceae bacterium]|nr:aspartate kinase [Candidatus Sacchlamyda saccharinae]
MSCVVMKFGGAAMASVERFAGLAKLIERRLNRYSDVVVVVSAMGSTTDELMELASKVHSSPPKREQDMLISVGERVSMALLAMALDAKGIEAISFTGSQSGIITTDEHADARILEVRPERIRTALGEGKVVIVAGFQGVSEAKEITTLGRGGSDTSAVALAVALGAGKVEFYKDVPGIGRVNPKVDPDTEIFSELGFDDALEIVGEGAEVLHHRCLEMAKENGVGLEIRPYYDPEWVGTTVCLQKV